MAATWYYNTHPLPADVMIEFGMGHCQVLLGVAVAPQPAAGARVGPWKMGMGHGRWWLGCSGTGAAGLQVADTPWNQHQRKEHLSANYTKRIHVISP